jgi:hypothetical protein
MVGNLTFLLCVPYIYTVPKIGHDMKGPKVFTALKFRLFLITTVTSLSFIRQIYVDNVTVKIKFLCLYIYIKVVI